jgi:hypothetical protein
MQKIDYRLITKKLRGTMKVIKRIYKNNPDDYHQGEFDYAENLLKAIESGEFDAKD